MRIFPVVDSIRLEADAFPLLAAAFLVPSHLCVVVLRLCACFRMILLHLRSAVLDPGVILLHLRSAVLERHPLQTGWVLVLLEVAVVVQTSAGL